MKILFVDFIYFIKEHRRMNIELINTLDGIGEVTVLAPKGYYEYLPETIELLEFSALGEETRYRNKVANSLKIMRLTAELDRKERFDVIWIASFDNLAFGIGYLFWKRKKNVYIMHHNNTDIIRMSRWNRAVFCCYKNKVCHVVMEEFIGEYLEKKMDIKKEYVHYVPHPAYDTFNLQDKIYECVGLSNSNQENLIEEIIELEKTEQIFLKRKVKVILRSKVFHYDNGYLKVINGYLPDDEYLHYVNHAKKLFLPYAESFCYRPSGTLIEALSTSAIAIGTPTLLMKEYSKRYKECCKIVEGSQEFVRAVCEEERNAENDFAKFKEEHSLQEVQKHMEKILKRKG